jgi:hypothetical protein
MEVLGFFASLREKVGTSSFFEEEGVPRALGPLGRSQSLERKRNRFRLNDGEVEAESAFGLF